MGKPVSSNVKRVETTGLNTKVDKKVFQDFKDRCAYLGYPMNVVLETFMRQYADGRFYLSDVDVIKWYKNNAVNITEVDTLNSTFNKEIYLNFKDTCKSRKYYVKYVITAFMEKFADKSIMLEYVNVDEVYGSHE